MNEGETSFVLLRGNELQIKQNIHISFYWDWLLMESNDIAERNTEPNEKELNTKPPPLSAKW